MRPRTIYALLAVAGTVLPLWQLVRFLSRYGPDAGEFVSQLFGTPIASFFAIDVIVSSIVLITFVLIDGSRRGMKTLWLPIVANLLVGVSLALPLFLWMREKSPPVASGYTPET
jgi:hypothetical protein